MRSLCVSVVMFLLAVTSSHGVVLDWAAISWTPGSLTQTFDLDSDGFNDITITFSGDTSALAGGSPAVSSGFQGGQPTPPSSLAANVDFSGTSGMITVTVTFLNTLATDVSFSLFDVDADRKGNSSNFAYQDQVLNLSAHTAKGIAIPAVTTGSLVSYSGGIAQGQDISPETGTGSGAGNVNLLYTNEISSFQFTFGSSSNIAGNNPDPQEFAISKITYRKVPEAGTALMAAGVCVLFALAVPLCRRWRSPAL